MPKKTSFTLWPVLLLATVALIGIYAFLPSFVERIAADSIRDRLGLERRPGVELESDTPLEMLAGEFSGGNISMEGAQFGGVRAESVTINLDPFDVSVLESVRSAEIRSEESLSGTLQVGIAEEEVARLARAGAEVPVRGVEIRRDGVLVRSAVRVLGVEVPLSIQGNVLLVGKELVFEPQRVEAFGSPLPEEFSERALAGTHFAYPIARLPYGAQISGVEALEGRLVLTGEVEGIPLGGPSS